MWWRGLQSLFEGNLCGNWRRGSVVHLACVIIVDWAYRSNIIIFTELNQKSCLYIASKAVLEPM